MTNLEYVKGLREVADWFEANPEVPLPEKAVTITDLGIGEAEKAATILIAKAMGTFKKEYDPTLFKLVKSFSGGITVRAIAWRKNVCEAKTVTKTVWRRIPVTFKQELVPDTYKEVQEQVQEIEWDCPSLIEEMQKEEK